MFEAKVRRKIQTELCQLHRNFGLQTALSDALQDFEIVLHDLSSLRAILDIFAQVCEDRPDLLPTQNLCGAKRILERFAGHEPGYSAPEKLVMCRAITQPLVLRRCEQHRSHETHGLFALESTPLGRRFAGKYEFAHLLQEKVFRPGEGSR